MSRAAEESPKRTAQDLPSRLDHLIAIAIAVASITMAMVIWHGTTVASSAGDAIRQGLINAIKHEAATSENWRAVYEEALFAQSYAVYAAEVKALTGDSDPIARAQLAKVEQFILPGLKEISPLASDPAYQNLDGSLNLQKRFGEMQDQYPDLRDLKPLASFDRAYRAFAHQLYLVVDVILFVITLFWLTMAQIARARTRIGMLLIAAGFCFSDVMGFALIEYLATRGL